MLLAVTSAAAAAVGAPAPALAATEPWTCDQFGYLFQSPNGTTSTPHHVQQVNLATGAVATGSGKTTRAVNGVGYNTLDDYFYGWDQQTDQLTRIHKDGTMFGLGRPTGFPVTAINVGDFDPSGHLWQMNSNATPALWFEVDLAPGASTPPALVAKGTIARLPGLYLPSDWSYVAGALFGVAETTSGSGNAHLLRFDRTSHVMSDLGAIAGVPSEVKNQRSAYGATYADASGFLYASNNESGFIYRIDPGTRAAILVSKGPTSSGNDGARCFLDRIPTVTLTKSVPARLRASDQFTVSLLDSGGDPVTSATTAGGATTASTTNWPVDDNGTYTITDAMAEGSASDLADYDSTITCTDTTTGAPVTPGGGAGSWTLPITTTHDYACTVTNTAMAQPAITIKKSAAPLGQSTFVDGQTITYTFVATNSGNVPLTNVGIRETDFTGSGAISAIACDAKAALLAPTEQTVCTATYTLTGADVGKLSVENTAVATGTPPDSLVPVESPPSTVVIPSLRVARLSLEKSADPVLITAAGQQVAYSYAVTNTGNVPVSGVNISETGFDGAGDLSSIRCPAEAASLAPGITVTCTATYTVTQADMDDPQPIITNEARAAGTDPGGLPVTSNEDSAPVDLSQEPSLELTKTVTPATVDAAGQTVTYTFTAVNSGNVTLTGAAVRDVEFSGTGTLANPPCALSPTTLAPGARATCTARYAVTQADINAGHVSNVATATGIAPDGSTTTSPEAPATVGVTTRLALALVKDADPDVYDTAGDRITYTFQITNNSSVAVTLSSIDETTFTGTGRLSTPTCRPTALTAPLAPSESITCTATYTVTQADVDRETIRNTAVAVGTAADGGGSVVSNPASAVVTVPGVTPTGLPHLDLTKSVAPDAVDTVGERITYTYLIDNTGGVPLSDLTLDETSFTGTGTLGAPSCAPVALAGPLAPGTATTCTVTYDVTQEDLDRGVISNVATASGKTPGGGTVTSPPSDTEVITNSGGAAGTPAIEVVKSGSPTSPARFVEGQTVTFTYLVTNVGDVTLTDVAVRETVFTGSGPVPVVSCPPAAASLEPGAEVSCTATYRLTAADVRAGRLKDTAVAIGTPEDGDTPITSAPSTLTIPGAPDGPVKQGLPVTGDDLSVSLLVGQALILGGLGLIVATRRRRLRRA
ncbi:DUF6923 family protein [Actinoplanes sp. NPDC049668]|uniref:DUF7507 domain-containing protein n=1 Tax=unclassified Actinoplanes TaxID=2626549 RepID=UPI0033AFD610